MVSNASETHRGREYRPTGQHGGADQDDEGCRDHEHDLDVAEVHAALAYYHDHPDEVVAVRDHRAAVVDDLAERSLAPEEPTR